MDSLAPLVNLPVAFPTLTLGEEVLQTISTVQSRIATPRMGMVHRRLSRMCLTPVWAMVLLDETFSLIHSQAVFHSRF